MQAYLAEEVDRWLFFRVLPIWRGREANEFLITKLISVLWYMFSS